MTVEIANHFIHSLSQLKGTFKMADEAFECLLVLHDHAYIKSYFITSAFGSEIFDHLNGYLSVKFQSST